VLEPPARNSAGRRTYTDDDIAWLVFLTRLRTTGMPLKVVREYVRLRRLGAAGVPSMRRILVDQRAALEARMEELRSCMDLLDYKIEKYGRLERSHCRRVRPRSTSMSTRRPERDYSARSTASSRRPKPLRK